MKSIISYSAIALFLLAGATSCSNDMEYVDVNATPVSLFYEPANGKAINLVASNTASLLFEWASAYAENGAVPQYEVVFYSPNDTENPLYRVVSDNTGTKPQATISHKTLASVCAAAGIAGGETGNLKWGVLSYAGVNGTKSTQLYDLTLTRYEGFAEIPTSLYFGGAGTETGGDDLSNAMALNAISADSYEAFAQLNAGQPIYFSADRDGATLYSLNGNKIVEGKDGSYTAPETGVYRITLDFSTASATLKQIESVTLYHTDRGNMGGDDFELPYVGGGVFQTVHSWKPYLTGWSWDPFESRYNFQMQYTDGSGCTWGPVNSGEDGKPGSMDNTSSYFQMTEYDAFVENKWKLFGDSETGGFLDTPATYSVYFNTTPYTHFYELN